MYVCDGDTSESFFTAIIIAMYLQSSVSRGVFSIEPLGEIRPAVYSHSKSNPPPLPLSQDDMLRFEKEGLSVRWQQSR